VCFGLAQGGKVWGADPRPSTALVGGCGREMKCRLYWSLGSRRTPW
jgi:hypothetical protein